VVGSKSCPSLFSGPVATNYHEASHEEGSVSLLGKVYTCVMVDLVVSVLTVIHKFFQLFAEKVNFTQIQRTEVCEKRFVHQVVINAEVEGMSTRLRRVLIRNPVEALGDNLN
jgi:hypothetical protein